MGLLLVTRPAAESESIARRMFANWLENPARTRCLRNVTVHLAIENIAEALATTDAECEHIVELLTEAWELAESSPR